MQVGRAVVGLRADVKIVSLVSFRAESRCGAGRGSFTDMRFKESTDVKGPELQCILKVKEDLS